jgi:hypothetical protein
LFGLFGLSGLFGVFGVFGLFITSIKTIAVAILQSLSIIVKITLYTPSTLNIFCSFFQNQVFQSQKSHEYLYGHTHQSTIQLKLTNNGHTQ